MSINDIQNLTSLEEIALFMQEHGGEDYDLDGYADPNTDNQAERRAYATLCDQFDLNHDQRISMSEVMRVLQNREQQPGRSPISFPRNQLQMANYIDAISNSSSHSWHELERMVESLLSSEQPFVYNILVQYTLNLEDTDLRPAINTALHRSSNQTIITGFSQALVDRLANTSTDEELRGGIDMIAAMFHTRDPALTRMMPEAVQVFLLQHLDHPDTNLRLDAANALWRAGIRNEQVRETFSQALTHENEEIRRNAIFSIGVSRVRLMLPQLIEILDDPAEEIRYAAIRALGLLRSTDHDVIDAIGNILENDTSPMVRQAAAMTLGVFNCEQAIPHLQTALENAEPELRRSIIFSLAELRYNNEQVISELARIAIDPNAALIDPLSSQTYCISLLEEIDSEESQAALEQIRARDLEALADLDFGIENLFERLDNMDLHQLAYIRENLPSEEIDWNSDWTINLPLTDPELLALRSRLTSADVDDQSKINSAWLLGCIGDTESIQILETAFEGASPELQTAILEALDRFDTPEADEAYQRIIEIIGQRLAEVGLGTDINRFSELSLAQISELISNRESLTADDRPLAVVILPTSDWNRAFLNHEIKDLMERGYRVVCYEANNELDFYQAVIEAGESQPISLLSIGGHGSINTTQFGNDYNDETAQLDLSDETEIHILRQYMADDSIVILDSCSTGEGGRAGSNIANMLGRIFIRSTIFAPTAPGVIATLNFDENNLITGATHYCSGENDQNYECTYVNNPQSR